MRNAPSLNLIGLAVMVIAAAALLGAGCSDSGTTPPPVNEFAPPTDLTVVNGPDQVFLRWQASPDAANSDFKGYNVYRHTATMAGATAAQLATYKQNAAYLTSTTYEDVNAVNGTKYFYAVRAVRGSNELSLPTNEFDTAPRHEGLDPIDIAEFQATEAPSGLNCATPQAYAMESISPDNRPFIDCYLGTLGANDETDQVLALKSPSRVPNGGQRWANRVADLMLLGTGQAAMDIPIPPSTGWTSQVELGANPIDKVIAVRTPADANGKRHYAKIWVIATPDTRFGHRVVSVLVAYQEIADYPRFVPAR